MTLIAALVTGGDALVGADLLMSTRGFAASFKPPLLSWIGDTRIQALVQKPVGLRQKLILLSDQICIAYSGRQDRAEFILERARKEQVPPSQIHDFVHEHIRMYSRSQRRSLSFIVLTSFGDAASDKETPFKWTAFHCRYTDLRNDKIVAGGSGADIFLQIFKSVTTLGAPANKSSRLDQYFNFYGAMSSISGYEFFGGSGVLERSIGGPYEIAGISRKRGLTVIQKIDKVLNLFWHIDIAKNERQLMLIGFWIFQFYHSNELFLLIYEDAQSGSPNYSILPVPGVFSHEVGASEACVTSMDIEFEPSVVINNVLVRRGGEYAGVVSRAEFDREVTRTVKIRLERGHVSLKRDLATLSERIAGTILKAERANQWGNGGRRS